MKPNILFFLIDACRADRLYGENSANTPNIDSLIKNGVYFEKNFSSTDYTFGSLGSILTSEYPFGVGENKQHYFDIHSTEDNFISHFKKNGYHAYGIMHTFLNKYGFSFEFENKDQEYPGSLHIHNGVGDRIIKKIESNEFVEPWFYFMHIMDLHSPIDVPKEFANESYSKKYNIMLNIIDSWIGKIIKKIDMENTLIVITADHGDYIPVTQFNTESASAVKKSKSMLKKIIPNYFHPYLNRQKYEMVRKVRKTKLKGSYEKRSLKKRPDEDRYFYDEVVNVPLVFSGYGIKNNRIIKEMVRSLDIFPTIGDIIQIEEKENIQGRSLLPLINGENIEEIPLYMESTIVTTDQKDPKPVIGIRTSNYKYFRRLHNKKQNVNLYDLKKDPKEEENLATKMPNIVLEMEKTLEQIRDFKTKKSKKEISDAQAKEIEDELKKLGYI